MEDDFVRAFQSLRHTHDLLLKDKHSLETCFEQETQEKDRLQTTLKAQTEGLRSVIRALRLQNRDSAEALASLGGRLDRYGCADIAPAASVILTDMADSKEGAGDLVARLTSASEQTLHLDRLRNKVVEQLTSALEAAQRRIADLQDSLRVAQRQAERHVYNSSVPPSPHPSAAAAAHNAFAPASPGGIGSGGAVTEEQLQMLQSQHAEEVEMLQARIAECEAELRDLRDEREAARELAASSRAKLERSLEDELNSDRGMLYTEQKALLRRHMELKIAHDELMETLQMTQVRLGNTILAMQKMDSYLRGRDAIILSVLEKEKPLKPMVLRKLVDSIRSSAAPSSEFMASLE